MQQALHTAILDSLSEGVFTVDTDWKITSFNRAAETITGISREDALGQFCADVLHSSLCENRCPIRQALDGKASDAPRSCFFVDVDGEQVPISLTAAVLRDGEGQVLGGVETFRDLTEVEQLKSRLRKQASELSSYNPAMQRILALLPVLADNPVSVLIQGETGTGKEVIAKAIHQQGARAKKPFVAINCGALPDHLLESELFGYKKGAFTGADRDKPGRFALVRDGTLFLDEVGEISTAMQVRLLRVLQEREYEPLGGVRAEPMLARVIAASHRDLLEMVKAGQFREDLYYRLDVVKLEMPPLRARIEDIPGLCNQLLARCCDQQGLDMPRISLEAMLAMQNHNWPGNIRQLANVIERALVLCRGDSIELAHLPDDFQVKTQIEGGAIQALQRAEADVILATLKQNNFNRTKTAESLGMHTATLYRKIKALRLLGS